jgi:peptidoglycan hydrolase CwlO-like protein
MSTEQFITLAIGTAVSIIGYFLKSLMNDHKETQKMAIENKAKIDLLENNHSHLNEKFDSLLASLKELTQEVKNLSKELSKKKDI